jgi:simple sugar transport system permease protein
MLHSRNIPTVAAGLILLLIFAAGAVRYDHFATPSNIANLLNDYAYIIIAAAGATLVILLGGIDLSVGSSVAFAGVLLATLIAHGWNPLAACALCLGAGAAIGASMGLLIQAFELPAFMVTLAGMFAVRAAGFILLSRTASIDHPFVGAASHAQFQVGGAASGWPAVLAILVAGIATIVVRQTPLGRAMCAIGGSERSARMMGVPIARTRVLTYTIAGACSALAGSTFALTRRAADPTSSVGLELMVIAAVVIGGTLLSGGVGSMLGTVIGVLIIGLIRMVIDFEGALNSAWTSIATGILLLVFVLLQKLTSTLSLKARSRYGVGSAVHRP